MPSHLQVTEWENSTFLKTLKKNHSKQTNNKQEQNKNSKVLGITLIIKAKDLYNRNIKTLRKVIDDIRRQKYMLCSYFGKIKIVEKAILTEAMNRFSAVP